MKNKKKPGRPTLSEEGVMNEVLQTRMSKPLKDKAIRVGPVKVRKSIKDIKE